MFDGVKIATRTKRQNGVETQKPCVIMLNVDVIAAQFNQPLNKAALSLGLSTTALKR